MLKRTVLTLFFFVFGLSIGFSANGFTLVIDAGHGGHDTGAKGATSLEKDINLKVALAFGQYVEQNCNDVKVIYTRKTDKFIPLKERANIANRNNADLFVSVHTNALPNGRIARGFEVYTLGMHRAKDNLDVAMRENSVIEEEDNYKQTYQGFDPKSSESYIMFEFMQSANMRRSVDLAKMIENSVCSTADRNDMGVHQAGFLVLRETSMPSCLIELGFITTPDEEEFLNTDEGVDKLANGIYKAFLQYKSKYSDKSSDKKKVVQAPSDNKDKAADTIKATTAKKDVKVVDNNTQNSNKKDSDAPKLAPAKKTITTAPDRIPTKVVPAKPEKVTPVKAIPAKATELKKMTDPKKVMKVEKVDSKHPVFKVQVFAVSRKLNNDDPLFKGHKDVDSYNEAGSHLTKYTIGSSTDYNSIVELRNSLKTDFPQAYIVAFKEGKPVNLSEAINEFKKHKKQSK